MRAALKRMGDAHVAHGNSLLNAEDFISVGQVSKILLNEVTSGDIDRFADILQNQTILPMQGISKAHHVFFSANKFKYKILACHCMGNFLCDCFQPIEYQLASASAFSNSARNSCVSVQAEPHHINMSNNLRDDSNLIQKSVQEDQTHQAIVCSALEFYTQCLLRKGFSLNGNTPLDGNCLFEAVAASLNDGRTASFLRTKVGESLERKSNDEMNEISKFLENMTFQEYVAKMKQNGTYADHLAIKCLSEELNTTYNSPTRG